MIVSPTMSGRHWVALLLVILAVALSAPAEARRRSKRPHRPRAYVNMPRDWTWPPSPQMKDSGKRCLAELDRLGVVWKKAPKERKVNTPIYVPSMELGGVALEPIWRKGPFVMDCHLALAVYVNADGLRKLGVRALRFSTIHKYRNVRKKGRTWRMLSRHAVGLAMDVYQVSLTDGRTLVVEDDYRSQPVLQEIEGVLRGSPAVRSVLTPGNDRRSHHDHFHIEAHMPIEPRPVG